MTHASDLSKESGVDSLYRAIGGRSVDVLCVNAGFGLGGPFMETDLQTELRMIDLNCRGAVQLAAWMIVTVVIALNAELLPDLL